MFLVKPDILLPDVVKMKTKVMKKKFLKFLWVRKVVYIGLLVTATVSQLILEVIKVVEICIKRASTLPQVIYEVIDVGQV